MQLKTWTTSALVGIGPMAGSSAFAQEKLTVGWVKGVYGIRPGDIHLSPTGHGMAARVIVVEPTGAETELLLRVGDAQIVVVIHGRSSAQPDQTVTLGTDTDKAHGFDSTSGQRLG